MDDQKDDNFDDDESLDGEDGEHKLFVDNFSNALTLIDHNVDLDSVLEAKTIGDALQILCPNMPGLPTKTRGKYLKRRHLNPAEKEMLMKYQNRDNARRTRKRKKLYDYFLKKLLAEVDEVLHPGLFPNSDKITVNNDMSTPPCASGNSANSTPRTPFNPSKVLQEERVGRAQKFLRLRASNRPEGEDWRSVCRGDIYYSSPGIFRDFRECSGIDALIEECSYRNNVIEKVIRSRVGASMQSTGIIDFEMPPEEIILGAAGNQLSFVYELRLFEAPLLPSGGLSSQTYWTHMWCTQVYCKMSFSVDGLIISAHEQFDATEIIRQTKVYLGRGDGEVTYTSTSTSTLDGNSSSTSTSTTVPHATIPMAPNTLIFSAGSC